MTRLWCSSLDGNWRTSIVETGVSISDCMLKVVENGGPSILDMLLKKKW